MAIFCVFAKRQPRRPFTPSFEGPLFSLIGEVPIEDPDPVGTAPGLPSLDSFLGLTSIASPRSPNSFRMISLARYLFLPPVESYPCKKTPRGHPPPLPVEFMQTERPTNSFRINSCEISSKQRTLTTFRINTYAKAGGGGPLVSECWYLSDESPVWPNLIGVANHPVTFACHSLLSLLFSISFALLFATEHSQALCQQSLPRSFPCNGGCVPLRDTTVPPRHRLRSFSGSALHTGVVFSSTSHQLRYFLTSSFSPLPDTILCFSNPRKRRPSADARNPTPPHSVRKSRTLCPPETRRSAHVYLWSDRLRLRAHRQLPHLRLSGHSPAVPQAPRLQAESRHEPDPRGRPHHRQRRGRRQKAPPLHLQISARLLRRFQGP